METQKRVTFAKDPERFIQSAIVEFVRKSPSNRRKVDGGKYWDTPLVGFASGSAPLFKQYKKIIGKFHFTPQEIFDLTFGKRKHPKELSVISWVLPASEDIRKSNRKETRYPSLLWSHARNFGDGQTRYEAALDRHHHDHLICTSCGNIVEFENERIEELQDRVAEEHGFTVTHHKLELYGLCARCNQEQQHSHPHQR